MVNTWYDNTCVVSCELYNNLTGVYLEKNVYAQGVETKVMHEVLKEKYRVPS